MEITLPKSILQSMLADAAEIGANIALTKAGLLGATISKSQAYRMYKRGKVDKWIRDGVLEVHKDVGASSSKWRIDRAQIEAIAKSDNRPAYELVRTNK